VSASAATCSRVEITRSLISRVHIMAAGIDDFRPLSLGSTRRRPEKKRLAFKRPAVS